MENAVKPPYSIYGSLIEYTKEFENPNEIFQDKFIVEVPYYGVVWQNQYNNSWKLYPSSRYITLDNFNEIKGTSGKITYMENDTMATPAMAVGDSLVYIVEDSLTLTKKYSYLIDSLEMQGFAINALGYFTDEKIKRPKSWGAIADNDTYAGKREKLGWVIAMYLTAFIPLGFFLSIRQSWEVRNALAKFGKFWTRFRFFFLLFIIIFLVCAGIINRIVLLGLGLIIVGIFFLYVMVKRAIMKSRRYTSIVK
jgi:hypothetical protein